MTKRKHIVNKASAKPTVVSPPNATLINKRIFKTQLYRVTQDIKNWRNALLMAENVYLPQRWLLYQLYQEIHLDAHVCAVRENRKDKILCRQFAIVNATGDEQSNKTAMFKRMWFEQFVEHTLDSRFWSHSLVVLGDILNIENPDLVKFKRIELMPRPHVIPEREIVTQWINGISSPNTNETTDTTFNWNDAPWCDWWVPIGTHRNFGFYNEIAPYFIYKKAALAAWSEYAEIFGIPPRIGQTDISDPVGKANMESMLENMGSASWGVFKKDDIIQVVESLKHDGVKVFENMVRICDEQISKIVSGGTLTTDAQGGQYKGEVHQETVNDKAARDAQFVEFVVNDELIPRMIAIGWPLEEGDKIKYDFTEKVTLPERAKIDKVFLDAGYILDSKYIEDTYNIVITGKESKVKTVTGEQTADQVDEDLQTAPGEEVEGALKTGKGTE